MSTVQITRLTTGEEVIAEVTQEGGSVTLKNPLLLIPMQEGRLTFASWMPYNADDSVTIKTDAIMFVINPVEEMAKQYIETVNPSQIMVPDKKIIV